MKMEQFELEKFVMDFFGLSDEITENDKIDVDFGQLVNLIAYFESKQC